MSINIDNIIFSSQLSNFTIIDSGYEDVDMTTTFTPGTSSTYSLKSGIDITKQFVLAFASEERDDSSVSYSSIPNYFETVVDVAGTPTTVFNDVYYYVTASGDLIVKFYSFGGGVPPGTYTVLDPEHFRVVWYLIDMEP